MIISKNPYAFKNSKLRICKWVNERVNELLKKFRKEEGFILRSTGATNDKITEIKKLLIIINEMSLTKPQAIHSNLYTKKARTDGESIRDAALRELSDSEPDDYIHGKYSRGDSCGDSRKRPRKNEEIEYVTDVNGFLNGDPMTLEEEHLMDEELLREMEETQSDVNTNEVIQVDAYSDSDADSEENQSWMNIPTCSRDCRHSLPLEQLDCQPIDVNDNRESVIDR